MMRAPGRPLIRLSLLFLLLSLGLVYRRPVPLAAQTVPPPPEITAGVDYTYGQKLTFFLRAPREEADRITTVTLTYSAPELPNIYTISIPLVPGRDPVARYTPPYKDLPLLPFTTLTYSWDIMLADGETLTIGPQTVDYVDNRYSWQSLVGPEMIAYWTEPLTVTAARAALEAAAFAQVRLDSVLAPDQEPIKIAIYPSTADLRATLRLTGRDLHPESGLPPADLPVIMVTAVNPRTATLDLERRVPEELARLRLYRVAGAEYDSLPGWLPAGLPALFETDFDSGYHSLAAANQGLDICAQSLSLDPAGAQALVHYLQRTFGDAALSRFILTLSAGIPCEQAVLLHFDLPAAEVTRLWQADVQSPSWWSWATGEYGLLIGFFLGSLLLMTLILLPRSGRKQNDEQSPTPE